MLQQGNLYTHISHCPGVNKNLVRGVILPVYFLNAYAVLVCTGRGCAGGATWRRAASSNGRP